MNLYEILEVNNNASIIEIKSSYKKLALKYHPDKNDGQTANKFYAITAAFTVLSDPEKKLKYDTFGYINKEDDVDNQTKKDIPQSTFNINDINFDNLDPRINQTINFFSAINTLCSNIFSSDSSLFHDLQMDEFIDKNKSEVTENKLFKTINKHFNVALNTDNNSDKQYESEFSQSELSECYSSDIIINIETTIEEIYYGSIKVITFNRQCLKNKQMIIEERKINIPICDDRLILDNEGNDHINDDGILVRGRVIVNVKCLYHKYYKRVNDYDVLLTGYVTDDELENGYIKKFKYFGGTVTIKSKKPKKKLKDGKIVTKINDNGLTFYENNDIKKVNRGNLIIILFTKK
jgi:DnaJ-class molecular chaperone